MKIETTRSSGTMKLHDPSSGRMRCTLCGAEHHAQIRPGGRYYRGSWQCPSGCKPSDSADYYNEETQ